MSLERRAFPVSLCYMEEATPDFLSSCLMVAKHIHKSEDKGITDKGGILIFLPGEDDIRTACDVLEKDCPDMDVLPLYFALPAAEQRRGLKLNASRTCVVATNTAETSLTIPDIAERSLMTPDIKYVVDCMLARQMNFNPRVGMHMLQLGPISKAEAVQRMKHAGRTGPGKCFRICTKEAYENHTIPSPVSAWVNCNMAAELLRLHEMGYDDVLRATFADPPAPEILFRAKEDLLDMGLIEGFAITEAGKLAAKLPVDPIWYCALSAGVKYGCVSEIMSLAAISSIQGSFRVRPRSRPASDASDFVWSHFAHPLSDHITLLNAMYAFMRTKAEGTINMKRWCIDHFISESAMEEVCRVRDKIRDVWTQELKQSHFTLSMARRTEPGYSTAVRRALAEGLFTHTAVLHNGRYTNVHDAQPGLLLHTSSVSSAEWIIYDSFVKYGLQYFQVVTAIESEWVMDLPYFQDSRLRLNYNRDAFRQPHAKELLDKARNAQA